MAGAIWKRLSGAVAVSTEHEFVRRIRPLLHVLWPDLTETPHRQQWDSFGIDLVEWTDSGPFPVVVQCKGWHVKEIGIEQARLVESSVSSFLGSGCTCEHFVVVHNREGKFVAFNAEAQRQLDRLVARGVARQVSLIDRHQLLNQVRRAILAKVQEGLRANATQRLLRVPQLFGRTRDHIEVVPYTTSTIQVRRDQPSLLTAKSPISKASVSETLLNSKGLSWTILEGPFGSGKTTAALYAAQSADRVVVLIPCADLPPTGNISLNDVLVESVRECDLWEALSAEEQSIVEPLAADAAIRLLSDPAAASTHLLVLDGLDEHRAFYSLAGFQRLLNQLIDIECPVVLTTRSEHFVTFFDSYTTAFADLSWKFKPAVSLPLLTLQPWTRDESVALITAVAHGESEEGAMRLHHLAKLVRSGEAETHYGTLPYSPLMLRFIIDDVAESGIDNVRRASLIARWVRRKLWRDVRGHPFIANGDVGDVVDSLIRATEAIAMSMTDATSTDIRLTESIGSEAVRSVLTSGQGLDPADILTNSFLMPVRSSTGTRVVFALRLLQEFFLASALRREGRPIDRYPQAIRDLHDELSAGET